MKIIPSSSIINSLDFYRKRGGLLLTTPPFKDDLSSIRSDRRYTSTDIVIEVFKIFVHPIGSNIIYPLSRRYLYSLGQTYYTRSYNRSTFISSFIDMNSAVKFICNRGLVIFNSLKDYEELLLLRGHVPNGSLFINYHIPYDIHYVESSSIILDIEEHCNKKEVFYL